MNSLLAQLDQGLIDAFTLEEISQISQGTTSQSELGTKFGANADVEVGAGALPGGGFRLGFNAGGNESESEISSVEIIDGQKDLLNKRFHDHALNILIKRLQAEDIIVHDDYNEGDLIKVTGDFDFYDFSLINVATNPKLWREIISWDDSNKSNIFTPEEAKRVVEKLSSGRNLTKKEKTHKGEAIRVHEINVETENIINVMKNLEVFSSTAEKLFKDLTLIKSNKLIGLLKKDFLRESTESLSFRGSNSRKATFLGRVIGVKDEIVDGTNMDEFSPHELNKIPNIMLDILLGSFNIIENGDTLISPIAIYYE